MWGFNRETVGLTSYVIMLLYHHIYICNPCACTYLVSNKLHLISLSLYLAKAFFILNNEIIMHTYTLGKGNLDIGYVYILYSLFK